jgi:glutathione synthase/RimK-type ligase-like ATP-grasp enzyme
MGVDVEPISKRDLAKVANHDALFIRETTSISNHTYRFARRARQEGMPVIDDPVSMIRCTNKVYLHELLGAANIAMPPTVIASSVDECASIAERIGFPMVVKIPDGSFSKGVKKASNMGELTELMKEWLKDTDLLICQKFMPTEFDWRVGVLGRKPLFVTQYLMAKKHWQIVNHNAGSRGPVEGGFRSVSLAEAPTQLIDMATRAAGLIGDGLYGVDIKETPEGFFVIEVNDNPNLDHGCEDASEKDAVWTRLTQWFIDRIDA